MRAPSRLASVAGVGVLVEDFVQEPWRGSDEYRQVMEVRERLGDDLNGPAIQVRIDEANQPGVSSALVQEAFLEEARALGFRSEARGLFQAYATPGLRPDYYLPIGSSGILMEVERGKTTINNMTCSTYGSAMCARRPTTCSSWFLSCLCRAQLAVRLGRTST